MHPYEVEEKLKRSYDNAIGAQVAEQPAQQQTVGYAVNECATTYRRPTEREEAEKRVGYHRTEADRAARAAAFFREHPEFDEFIGLIRSGVVHI